MLSRSLIPRALRAGASTLQHRLKPHYAVSNSSVVSSIFSTQHVRLYHENVIDHYEHPRNVGSLDKSRDDVGTGLVGAPACGDVMKLQIRADSNGKILETKFKTFGCGSAIASSSLASTWLEGKSIEEAVKIKNSDIAKHLNLPPVKLHCSMLAEDAIKAAVADLKRKRQKAAAGGGQQVQVNQQPQPQQPKQQVAATASA